MISIANKKDLGDAISFTFEAKNSISNALIIDGDIEILKSELKANDALTVKYVMGLIGVKLR